MGGERAGNLVALAPAESARRAESELGQIAARHLDSLAQRLGVALMIVNDAKVDAGRAALEFAERAVEIVVEAIASRGRPGR
jgi:hypothetical protein